MAKPKLLVISPAKSLGGGEIYLKNVLPALVEHYDVKIIGPRFLKKFLENGYSVAWLPLSPPILEKIFKRTHRLKQAYYRLLFKFYNLKKYNLVSMQWFDGEILEALQSQNIILTLQTGFLIPRQYDEYVTKVLKNVSRIICVSEQAKNQLTERGVDKQKCVVVGNGIDLVKYPFLSHTGEFITWVGRVEEADKNPALFVQVAKKAFDLNLPYRFRIVGSGSYLPVIKVGCPDNLDLVGAVAPSDMPNIYKTSKLLCMTSTSEGLPFVALEAMASGIPVVATAVGGLKDLLADGAGMLIDKFDADEYLERVQAIIKSSELYNSIRQRARKKIESKFSLNNMQEQTIKIYQEVVK